jgi:hypothetical protein
MASRSGTPAVEVGQVDVDIDVYCTVQGMVKPRTPNNAKRQ